MTKTEETIKSEEIFTEFRKACLPSGWKYADAILKKFDKLQNKDDFIVDAMKFLKAENDDIVRSWGTTLLERIGSDKAFYCLIEFLNSEDPTKKKYMETRLFAVRAIKELAKKEPAKTQARTQKMLEILTKMATDSHEATSARVGAMVVHSAATEDQALRSDYKKEIKEWLSKYKDNGNYENVFYTLRAIREIEYPHVLEELQEVLDHSIYVEHKRYAIKALAQYKDEEAINKLGLVIRLNSDSSLRLEAVKSLAFMNNENTQSSLFPALLDDDAEIRNQASKALKSVLGAKAVRLVIQSALDGNKDEDSINYLTDALRIIDDSDRTLSTEVLNKEIISEDRARAELAQKILLQLGGWAAVQRLSQRKSTIETMDKVLNESEAVVRKIFEATILQATRNFYFAMGVNITIVIVGLILVSIAIMQLIKDPGKLETWILPGIGGLFGIILSLYFNNPRNHAREDLTTLMNVNVIFLGFLRRLNEIDATFKHAYIESYGIQADQDAVRTTMTATVGEIKKTMTETLEMASAHLRGAPQAPQDRSKDGKNETQQESPSK
jgi:HEAT repeat protein